MFATTIGWNGLLILNLLLVTMLCVGHWFRKALLQAIIDLSIFITLYGGCLLILAYYYPWEATQMLLQRYKQVLPEMSQPLILQVCWVSSIIVIFLLRKSLGNSVVSKPGLCEAPTLSPPTLRTDSTSEVIPNVSGSSTNSNLNEAQVDLISTLRNVSDNLNKLMTPRFGTLGITDALQNSESETLINPPQRPIIRAGVPEIHYIDRSQNHHGLRKPRTPIDPAELINSEQNAYDDGDKEHFLVKASHALERLRKDFKELQSFLVNYCYDLGVNNIMYPTSGYSSGCSTPATFYPVVNAVSNTNGIPPNPRKPAPQRVPEEEDLSFLNPLPAYPTKVPVRGDYEGMDRDELIKLLIKEKNDARPKKEPAYLTKFEKNLATTDLAQLISLWKQKYARGRHINPAEYEGIENLRADEANQSRKIVKQLVRQVKDKYRVSKARAEGKEIVRCPSCGVHFAKGSMHHCMLLHWGTKNRVKGMPVNENLNVSQTGRGPLKVSKRVYPDEDQMREENKRFVEQNMINERNKEIVELALEPVQRTDKRVATQSAVQQSTATPSAVVQPGQVPQDEPMTGEVESTSQQVQTQSVSPQANIIYHATTPIITSQGYLYPFVQQPLYQGSR